MAIYSSAGHNEKKVDPNTGKIITTEDPGASGCGYNENDLTLEMRNLTNNYIRSKYPNVKLIEDRDDESLREYLKRIEPGTASVVHEYHFNAFNTKASGVEVVVPDNPTKDERNAAQEICDAYSKIMGIPNRGVKTESQSKRSKLALMREEGINLLTEVCFIDNQIDINAYQTNKSKLAEITADILVKYDNLY